MPFENSLYSVDHVELSAELGYTCFNVVFNIKANNNEKEDFYRPHYNYNLAQRNLAYQCKSAIEYGGNVDSIKYNAPKPPTPPPTPPPKPKPNPTPPKEDESKPKPPPPPTSRRKDE